MSASTAMAFAVAAAVGWALFDLARRGLADRMGAWALVVWLTLGALPLVGASAVAAGDWRVTPGYWTPAVASVLLNVGANFGYFRAFQLSPISVTLPMLTFTPLFASLLGAAFLGEPLGPRATAGAALVVAGGLAVGLRQGGLRFEAGSAWMLAVAFLWSATLLLDKRALAFASPYLHAVVLNAGVALGGAGALVLAGGARRELASVRGNAGRLALAVAIGAAALVVQLLALRALPMGGIETLKRGVGGFSAVLLGRLLFAEPLTLRKVAGVALMTAGVALLLLDGGWVR